MTLTSLLEFVSHSKAWYQELCDFNRNLFSQFWRLEVQDEGVSRVAPSEAGRESLFLASLRASGSFWQSLVFPGL